jgi:hypothetical protein
MYFPLNWEFGSDLSKLRNFGGGGVLDLPTPPRYATDMQKRHGNVFETFVIYFNNFLK